MSSDCGQDHGRIGGLIEPTLIIAGGKVGEAELAPIGVAHWDRGGMGCAAHYGNNEGQLAGTTDNRVNRRLTWEEARDEAARDAGDDEIGLKVAGLRYEKTFLTDQIGRLTVAITINQKDTLTALDRALFEMAQQLLNELPAAGNEDLVAAMKADR